MALFNSARRQFLFFSITGMLCLVILLIYREKNDKNNCSFGVKKLEKQNTYNKQEK